MKSPTTYLPLPLKNPFLLIPEGPARIQTRSFLLYAPGSIRGKALRLAGIAAARLGLYPLFYRRRLISGEFLPRDAAIAPILNTETLEALQEDWQEFFNKDQVFFAISLGTPDQYRKLTALLFDQRGEILALAKIGVTPQAIKLIEHEFKTLKYLRHMDLSRGITPEPLYLGSTGEVKWLLQSALVGGRPSPLKLNAFHLSFLADLAKATFREEVLSHTSFWNSLADRILGIGGDIYSQPEASNERRFMEDLFRECRDVLQQAGNLSWPLVAAHGDFAPWNIRKIGGRAAVYDWENFLPLAPAGWDVLHYEVRIKNLVKRRSLKELFSDLSRDQKRSDPLCAWEMKTGIRIPERRLLVLLFFGDLGFGASRKAIADGNIHLGGRSKS